MPSTETIEKIARATSLDPGWLAFECSIVVGSPHHRCPGFDSDALVTDLLSLLRANSGVIDDVYKYLDSTVPTNGEHYCISPTSVALCQVFQ